jgi:hypothetical protein
MAAFAATASKCGARADMDKSAIDIAKTFARLSELTIFELRGEWRRLHRMPPPMRLSRDLLIRGIIYKLQERAYGGLSMATARKLERASADPLGRGAAKPAPSVSLRPGTRLVREWRGVTHTALIHADGIEWRGQRFRSLSLVARKITGAPCDAPVTTATLCSVLMIPPFHRRRHARIVSRRNLRPRPRCWPPAGRSQSVAEAHAASDVERRYCLRQKEEARAHPAAGVLGAEHDRSSLSRRPA